VCDRFVDNLDECVCAYDDGGGPPASRRCGPVTRSATLQRRLERASTDLVGLVRFVGAHHHDRDAQLRAFEAIFILVKNNRWFLRVDEQTRASIVRKLDQLVVAHPYMFALRYQALEG